MSFATPPPRSRWRLRAGPTRRWRVAELSFHAVCGAAPVAGVFLYAPLDPVVGNTATSFVGALRDGNRATIWSSSCWQCADGEAWLGVALDEAAVGNGVQCVRLLQDRADSAEPPALALQVLDGAWTSVATWPSVAVGDFATLRVDTPAGGWAYRLRAVASAADQGTRFSVAELGFFADAACATTALQTPRTFASGFFADNEPARAVDGVAATVWESAGERIDSGLLWVGAEVVTAAACARATALPQTTVALELWTDGAWLSVGSGTTDAAGAAVFQLGTAVEDQSSAQAAALLIAAFFV